METQTTLTYSHAALTDLPVIVDIYNSTIASRMVTADTEPVSVESKRAWFSIHNPETRPLLLIRDTEQEVIGWLSFQSFYGRPAYNGTAEISIYLAEIARGKGYGRQILRYALALAPQLSLHTVMAFIFAHNAPSLRLFKSEGFEEWGNFPNIALLDGIYRSLTILGRKM